MTHEFRTTASKLDCALATRGVQYLGLAIGPGVRVGVRVRVRVRVSCVVRVIYGDECEVTIPREVITLGEVMTLEKVITLGLWFGKA